MKKTSVLFPQQERHLAQLGENLKFARLRRKLSAEMVAERAGISRATLVKIEQGSPSVAMGHYASVLNTLGLGQDIARLASDDDLGRKLQDAELSRKRAPRRNSPTAFA